MTAIYLSLALEWNNNFQAAAGVGESTANRSVAVRCLKLKRERKEVTQREGRKNLGHLIFRTTSPQDLLQWTPFCLLLTFRPELWKKMMQQNHSPFRPIKKQDLPTIAASKRCWYLPDSFGFSQVLIKELGLRHWLLFQLRDSSHNSSQFTSSFRHFKLLRPSQEVSRSAWGLCSPPFVFDAFVARCWHLLEYLFWCNLLSSCVTAWGLSPRSSSRCLFIAQTQQKQRVYTASIADRKKI